MEDSIINNITYKGQFVKDFTREQLLEVVEFAYKQIKKNEEQHRSDMNFFSFLRKSYVKG
jgi:hypothetical protein